MNKEYYIEQIKAIGQHLINNAERILDDFDETRIREINIISNIRGGEFPNIEINKSYIPYIPEELLSKSKRGGADAEEET